MTTTQILISKENKLKLLGWGQIKYITQAKTKRQSPLSSKTLIKPTQSRKSSWQLTSFQRIYFIDQRFFRSQRPVVRSAELLYENTADFSQPWIFLFISKKSSINIGFQGFLPVSDFFREASKNVTKIIPRITRIFNIHHTIPAEYNDFF